MKLRIAILIATFAGPILLAQVSAPKRESWTHRLFTSHRENDNLERRSMSLGCALVLINAGDRTGTGFYVSSDGDVATAAHVVGDKVVAEMPGGQFLVDIISPAKISVKSNDGNPPIVYSTNTILQNNPDAFAADVALLRTGKKVSCWLSTADDGDIRTGQHVLALGFPGLAFGSLSMYSGVVSSRLRAALPTGKTLQGHPVTSNVQLVRLQMPISPGLSGAPVVDDQNRAIAVITSAGVWSQDLDFLLQWERLRESRQLPMPNGILDFPTLLGELAEMFHDYGSPGYGDAVPMRYLETAPVAGQPPATHPNLSLFLQKGQ
jgi:Trypsin-like peptidase domain